MMKLLYYLVLTLAYFKCTPPPIHAENRCLSFTKCPNDDHIELDSIKEFSESSEPSYQNDTIDVRRLEEIGEQGPYLSTTYAFLRKCRLAASSASFGLIFVLMLHIHQICWDPKIPFTLAIMGCLIAVPMMFEFILSFFGYLEHSTKSCDLVQESGPPRAIKFLVTTLALGLQIMRMATALTPVNPEKSIVDELCSWTGDNLFTSTEWNAFVFTPSILLMTIPLVELLIGYLYPGYLNDTQRRRMN